MAEDLGLVWLHVVSPPDIENDLTSVSENWGNFGGGDETEARDRARAAERTRSNLKRRPLRRASRRGWTHRARPPPGAELQAHADAARAVAVPALRALYRRQPNDVIPGLSNQSYEDQGQLDVLLQRHFLQTGFADLELQQLWKRLKSTTGLWDDSLIVVAADHGVAFPHARERRRLGRETAARDRAGPAVHQGARPDEGRPTTPGSRRSTSCRRSSTS